MHPADELGTVRAQIATLKAREDELRATLAMQRRDLTGSTYRAVFKPRSQRVFLRDKLPDYILNAPDLWEMRTSTALCVERRQVTQAQPVQARMAFDDDDDVIVVERWSDAMRRAG